MDRKLIEYLPEFMRDFREIKFLTAKEQEQAAFYIFKSFFRAANFFVSKHIPGAVYFLIPLQFLTPLHIPYIL